jgi:EmrB/QacA subfamily drug resistance transporter
MALINEGNRRWWILVAMTGSLSMILLDQTIVSVALPSIQRDLDLTQTEVQWVVNAYLLAIAALVAVGGRMSTMFNAVRMFQIGVIVFAVGSAATGLADGETAIIAARALQGVGAALMIPPSGALVINTFPQNERGRAMGIYAGVSMVFLSLGPLIGGLLTEIDWRLVFWVNVPVAIVTILLTIVAKPQAVAAGGRFDWWGAATLVPGLVALVLALQQGSDWGWSSPLTIGLLAAAAVLIVAFLIIEPRVHEPLVELRLFLGRNFAGNNAVLFLVQFALVGMTVFGAIFVQDILGFSSIEAGLSMMAVTLPLLVLAPLAGGIYDKIGPRGLVAAGCAAGAAGMIWTAAILDKDSYPWMIPGYVFIGAGIGLVMGPSNTDAMSAAAAEFRAQAQGVIQTMRQVGATIGLAIMGVVVTQVENSRLESSLGALGLPESAIAQVENVLSKGADGQQEALVQVPAAEQAAIVADVQDSVTDGIAAALYIGGGALLLGAIVAFLVLRHVHYDDEGDPPVVAAG